MAKTKRKPKRESLLACTIRLLKHRDRTITLEMLAKKCDCSAAFLSSLGGSNPPKDPSVNTIQKLHEALSGQHLEY